MITQRARRRTSPSGYAIDRISSRSSSRFMSAIGELLRDLGIELREVGDVEVQELLEVPARRALEQFAVTARRDESPSSLMPFTTRSSLRVISPTGCRTSRRQVAAQIGRRARGSSTTMRA